MLTLLLFACTKPEPAALSACQAVTGLSTDAAGLALLEPVLVPAEVALLKAAAPTRGLEVVGSDGLAEIRSRTTCSVTATNSAGSGRWAVTLQRFLPAVGADGSLGEPQEQTLEWQVISEDGVRVETGLPVADSMRRSIAEAVEEGDHARVTASWKAIQRTYGDPLIAVDLAEAEAVEAAWRYRTQMEGWVEEVLKAEVVVAVENKGERDVSAADLTVTFEVSGEKVPADVALPAVKAGETGRINVAIPEGAKGRVSVKVNGVTF